MGNVSDPSNPRLIRIFQNISNKISGLLRSKPKVDIFTDIERLLQEGNLSLALERLNKLQLDEGLNKTILWEIELFEARIMIEEGEYGNAEKIGRTVSDNARDADLLLVVDASIVVADSLWFQDEYDASLSAVSQGMKALTSVKGDRNTILVREAQLFFHEGRNYIEKDEHARAIDLLEKSFMLCKRMEIENKSFLTRVLLSLGLSYRLVGEFEVALEKYNQARVWSSLRLGIT